MFRSAAVGCAVAVLAATLGLSVQASRGEAPARAVMGETGFDDGWRFFLGDDKAASAAAFDDSQWRGVDLPHDWGVEQAFDPKLACCTAFLPAGVGWYRKSFTLRAEDAAKVVRVRFDGVMNHSTVWCNGKEVGGRPYGYSSFTCDLTGVVEFGEAERARGASRS